MQKKEMWSEVDSSQIIRDIVKAAQTRPDPYPQRCEPDRIQIRKMLSLTRPCFKLSTF